MNRKGVTLLEIVIAAFILAIAFIPVLRVVDFGAVATVKVGNQARAARLAQQLIEECKHVPFQVYQRSPTYNDLADGVSEDIMEDFYKETAKSIQDFFDENRDSFREYGKEAKLRLRKNELQQIVEVWFDVEIFWQDSADGEGVRRVVRAGNAYYNTEAR